LYHKVLDRHNIFGYLDSHMAKLKAFPQSDIDSPAAINIGDRAVDNLRFIRETMERSTHFTAVPGYGGMLMGVTAIVAAYIAHTQPYMRGWLITWLVEAFLAFSIGMLAMWQKSKLDGSPLVSAPSKKFAMGFLPPLAAGVAITLGLWRYEHYEMMAPVWMLCYGAAVVCGGAFSVSIVPIMGWCFIAFGALAFALPASLGNYLLAASFGVMHIIFGVIIGRRYGG
jgi:hypothetical protein